MNSIKVALALLPSVVRAALLWFKLHNHLAYVHSLRTLDDSIARLEDSQRLARAAGDSDGAIRLLYEADDARAVRESLSAAYLELAVGSPPADSAGNIHPGAGGSLAQPPVSHGS